MQQEQYNQGSTKRTACIVQPAREVHVHTPRPKAVIHVRVGTPAAWYECKQKTRMTKKRIVQLLVGGSSQVSVCMHLIGLSSTQCGSYQIICRQAAMPCSKAAGSWAGRQARQTDRQIGKQLSVLTIHSCNPVPGWNGPRLLSLVEPARCIPYHACASDICGQMHCID